MSDINQTILLTGGTGSVGSMLLQTLPRLNYKVFFTSRSQEKIDEIESSVNRTLLEEIKIEGIKIDLTTENYLSKIASYFEMRKITPTALINNVRDIKSLEVNNGITHRKKFMDELEMSILIPYELSMMFAETEKLKKIINIASMYGVVPPNFNLYDDGYKNSPIQYGVAKAGLIHLTKELAVRLAVKNILVNSISYGGVEGRVDKAFEQRYSLLTPTGRMLTKSEVSGPVSFLLSEDSSGMTGHNLIFDGGYTVW
jgi:NAD(P)-dependent dehydrogenase (short-subunit alcohol dehydrogenase family)